MHDNAHQTDAPPPGVVTPPNDRRRLLRLFGGAGLLLAGGSIFGLGGCGSSRSSRADGSTVGEPIPDNPTLYRAGPSRVGPSTETVPAPSLGSASRPRIVERSAWTKASPILSRANRMGGIDRITIHHDGIRQAATGGWSDVSRRLESIRRGHVGQGWADIGYHYAIDPAGRIWACRPIDLQGAHVRLQNEHNLGILVVGNYQNARPTPQAMASLEQLVGYEMRRFAVPLHRVRTHRELAATACPGRYLQPQIEQMRAGSPTLASSHAAAIRRS